MAGKDVLEILGEEVFPLWRACRLSDEVVMRTVGRRYLRFDRNVETFARLSPSIQREFMTYTVVGLKRDLQALEKKAAHLEEEIKRISSEKEGAARQAVQAVLQGLGRSRQQVEAGVCFILGGDVPLGMAHADPRPEKSTGLLVAGSDLDLVVVYRDGFPKQEVEALDEAIYAQKYALLNRPQMKEEIDYIIKSLSRVREQAAFETFEDMVACKIIMEGKLVGGSRELYREVMGIMAEAGVEGKLEEMEELARVFRERAEAHLLESTELSEEDYIRYFATTEEIGEIF